MRRASFARPSIIIEGPPHGVSRVGICDYIAGMTDKFAVDQYSDAFIPKAWTVK